MGLSVEMWVGDGDLDCGASLPGPPLTCCVPSGPQAVRVQELRFQMAVRDQIISEQREVISNLWRIIDKSGLGRARVLEIAKQVGQRLAWHGVFACSCASCPARAQVSCSSSQAS